MKLVKDKQDNVLILENCLEGCNLFIRLAKERHRRLIGRINKTTRRMHIERDPYKHLLNKANSYGFNHHVLEHGQTFDHVVIHELQTKKIFKIPRLDMLEEGQFLFFKEQGFEKQIFLKREWIERYEITQPTEMLQYRAEKRLGI